MSSRVLMRPLSQLLTPAMCPPPNLSKSLKSILGTKLVLDLDGDVVTLGSGDRVAAWPDLSAFANTVSQGTLAKQPTHVLAALDGHAALQFTASDAAHLFTNTFSGIPAATPFQVFTIATMADLLDNRTFSNFGSSIGISSHTGPRLYYSVAGALRAGHSMPALYAQHVAWVASSSYRLVDYEYSTTIVLRVQNAPQDNPNPATVNVLDAQTQLTVGLFNDRVTAPHNGRIARMFAACPLPTAAELVEVLALIRRTYPSLALP